MTNIKLIITNTLCIILSYYIIMILYRIKSFSKLGTCSYSCKVDAIHYIYTNKRVHTLVTYASIYLIIFCCCLRKFGVTSHNHKNRTSKCEIATPAAIIMYGNLNRKTIWNRYVVFDMRYCNMFFANNNKEMRLNFPAYFVVLLFCE